LIKFFIMEQTSVWWVLVALTVGAEMLTGTLYLLLLAAGMFVGAVFSMMGYSLPIQLIGAAVVAGTLVLVWMGFRQYRRQHMAPSVQTPSIADLDVGQTVLVDHWDANASTSVRYRGATWHAVPALPGDALSIGAHEVVELRGNTLVIRAAGQ
jgi:membrane protein implicated in regulation of membrane protease activity